MQIKYSKLIVKDASGNLIQLLPETKVDVVLDSTSSFPIANSVVTQNINNILQKLVNYIGATSESSGVAGFIPPATSSERNYFLKGDGTWTEINIPIIDANLSSTSTNGIQNKTVYSALSGKVNIAQGSGNSNKISCNR